MPATAVEVLASEHASIDVTAEHDGRRAHFSVAWSAESALIDAGAVITAASILPAAMAAPRRARLADDASPA